MGKSLKGKNLGKGITQRKDGRYLVTNSHWGAYEVDWNIFFNNQGWLWEKGVIAWMPLPEPYKS